MDITLLMYNIYGVFDTHAQSRRVDGTSAADHIREPHDWNGERP